MLNNADIVGGDLAGEVVDVDGMVERIAALKGERGVTVIGQMEFGFGETRRVRSPVVPGVEDLQPRRVGGGIERQGGDGRERDDCADGSQKRVRPSWGGKINPLSTRLVGEADERFRCGQ